MRTYFSDTELCWPSENEDPVDIDVGNNSDAERINRIRCNEDDRVEAIGELQACIDLSRYAVTIGSLSSVVTIWWREREKGDYWNDYVRADGDIRRLFGPKSRTLGNTSIYSIGSHWRFFASMRYLPCF